VIKLIRTIVDVGSQRNGAAPTPVAKSTAAGELEPVTGVGSGLGTVPLSENVMRGLIAVADHPEDPLRFVCLATLAEIGEPLSHILDV